MLTKIFKSGDLLAVLIPTKIAFDTDAPEVEIKKRGNTLLIKPVERKTLAGIGDIFKMFNTGFMAGGREFNEHEID